MKRIALRFMIVCTVVLFCACDRYNEKRRVTIPGTVISLRPPATFVPASGRLGFWNKEKKASVLVAEIPNEFQAVVERVKKGDTLAGNLIVLSMEKVSVEGRNGMLYKLNKVDPPYHFNQWMLALPVAEYTVAVTGSYRTMDEHELSDNIRKAVLTTHIGEDQTPLIASVPFEIDVSQTFRLAKVLQGPSVVYTADGKWSDSSMFAASLYVGPSYRLPHPIDDPGSFSMSNFKRICIDCVLDSASVSPVRIDSLQGWEMWGYTSDVHKLKYQVILFDASQYYLAVGTAVSQQQERLHEFQEFVRSFKRKSLKS